MKDKSEVRIRLFNAEGCNLGESLTVENAIRFLQTTPLYKGDKLVVEVGVEEDEDDE